MNSQNHKHFIKNYPHFDSAQRMQMNKNCHKTVFVFADVYVDEREISIINFSDLNESEWLKQNVNNENITLYH